VALHGAASSGIERHEGRPRRPYTALVFGRRKLIRDGISKISENEDAARIYHLGLPGREGLRGIDRTRVGKRRQRRQ
jgi:hypothetical protein